MSARSILVLTALAVVAAALPVLGEDLPLIAITGGEVHTMEGRVLAEATVLVAEGKIRAVRRGTRVPAGYQVIDAAGMKVYPGFIAATASGLGMRRNLGGHEKALHLRVSHAVDPHARSAALASSHGITAAYLPLTVNAKDGEPFAGTGSVIRILPGGDTEDMVLREPSAVEAILDTAARRFAFRQALAEAVRAEGKKREDPATALLVRVADGELPVRVSGGGYGLDASQVLEATGLARSLDVRMILDRPLEAWVVAETLAERQVPVVQHARTGGYKPRRDERRSMDGGWRLSAPATLVEAGVPVALAPSNPSVSTRGTAGRDLVNLTMEAAFAVRGGLSDEEALRAITIDAARILGLDDRIGSIRRGKDADLVVLDGDPLHYRTFVRWTIAGGRIAYDASETRHWKRILERRDEYLQGEGAWPEGRGE